MPAKTPARTTGKGIMKKPESHNGLMQNFLEMKSGALRTVGSVRRALGIRRLDRAIDKQDFRGQLKARRTIAAGERQINRGTALKAISVIGAREASGVSRNAVRDRRVAKMVLTAALRNEARAKSTAAGLGRQLGKK